MRVFHATEQQQASEMSQIITHNAKTTLAWKLLLGILFPMSFLCTYLLSDSGPSLLFYPY